MIALALSFASWSVVAGCAVTLYCSAGGSCEGEVLVAAIGNALFVGGLGWAFYLGLRTSRAMPASRARDAVYGALAASLAVAVAVFRESTAHRDIEREFLLRFALIALASGTIAGWASQWLIAKVRN